MEAIPHQKDVFDDIAKEYHHYNKYYFEGRLSYITAALKDAQNQKVLDLGCGIGMLIAKLKEIFPTLDFYGVDYSEGMIKNAIVPNVFVGDAENLAFASGTFDVIIMSDVIEHVDHVDKTMANCTRCVKSGGRVVVTTPNPFLVPLLNLSGKFGLSFADEHRLDLREVRKKFADNGFKVIDERMMNLYPFGPQAIRNIFLKIELLLPMSLKNYICFSKCFTLAKT
jgi:ubiquinone/menaquinone biosynthesis C-methylase UbiE